jgi:hypothetical protein
MHAIVFTGIVCFTVGYFAGYLLGRDSILEMRRDYNSFDPTKKK